MRDKTSRSDFRPAAWRTYRSAVPAVDPNSLLGCETRKRARSSFD